MIWARVFDKETTVNDPSCNGSESKNQYGGTPYVFIIIDKSHEQKVVCTGRNGVTTRWDYDGVDTSELYNPATGGNSYGCSSSIATVTASRRIFL